MLLSSVLMSIGTGARRDALAVAADLRRISGRDSAATQVITFVKAWLFAERGTAGLGVRLEMIRRRPDT